MRLKNTSIKEIKGRPPNKKSKVTVCITNQIIELVIVEKRSNLLKDYQRINKNEYLDLRTGEVKEYSNCRGINKNRSFNKLRQFINANFTGGENEVFLTLTYSNPEFNRSQVSNDIKSFWKRFKYRNKTCEYIAIFEPHQNGAWHIHMLIKDLHKKYLFININEVRTIWTHGNIMIKKLKGNDNIGAYFSAICQADNDKKSVKASRIKYYPKFSKCFTHSSKIKKPIYKTMSYEEVLKLIENKKEVYSKTFGVFDDDDNEVNSIIYKQFNKKRND